MEQAQFDHYKNTDLQSFATKLNNDHYNVLGSLCENAYKQVKKLFELEERVTTHHYISLCKKLIEDIQLQVQLRKDKLMPYLGELVEKNLEKHDCANCNGASCALKHEMQVTELSASLSEIKSILYRLQMAALPLYSETLYPDAYRILRNQMALLENGLTELYFLEGAYLVPKIKEMQKNINARD